MGMEPMDILPCYLIRLTSVNTITSMEMNEFEIDRKLLE